MKELIREVERIAGIFWTALPLLLGLFGSCVEELGNGTMALQNSKHSLQFKIKLKLKENTQNSMKNLRELGKMEENSNKKIFIHSNHSMLTRGGPWSLFIGQGRGLRDQLIQV